MSIPKSKVNGKMNFDFKKFEDIMEKIYGVFFYLKWPYLILLVTYSLFFIVNLFTSYINIEKYYQDKWMFLFFFCVADIIRIFFFEKNSILDITILQSIVDIYNEIRYLQIALTEY